jgi:hypothetical protein
MAETSVLQDGSDARASGRLKRRDDRPVEQKWQREKRATDGACSKARCKARQSAVDSRLLRFVRPSRLQAKAMGLAPCACKHHDNSMGVRRLVPRSTDLYLSKCEEAD